MIEFLNLIASKMEGVVNLLIAPSCIYQKKVLVWGYYGYAVPFLKVIKDNVISTHYLERLSFCHVIFRGQQSSIALKYSIVVFIKKSGTIHFVPS